MFKRSRIKIYNDFLKTLPYPAEIRSFHNKVLAMNKDGESLFGGGEDPFFAFRDKNPAEDIKKIESAYLQRTTFQLDVKDENQTWRLRLSPMGNSILLSAFSLHEELSLPQAAQTQIALFQNIIQHINIPLYLTDISGEIIYINSYFSDLLGYSYDKILGQKISTFLDSPDLKSRNFLETDINLSTPQGVCIFTLKQTQIQTQGSPLFCGILYPFFSPQLETTAQMPPLPFAKIDIDTQTILQSDSLFLKALHLSQTPKLLSDIFSQESVSELLQKLSKVQNYFDFETTIELSTIQNQTYQVFPAWATPDRAELNLYFLDITSRKNLEEQLLQTHKMEALGQLTGGIAHDFNNILTAIMGFTDLLLQQHPAGDTSFDDLMHIKGNVQKAAGLVGQLLTFSRKTPIQEHLISVHDAFVDLTSLLQRAIAPHCHLKMEYKRNLGFIRMDISQLTQIFLNFAINAKDAMPQGGDLIITLTKEEIKKARPCGNDLMPTGSYIKITAADNGSGIPADILPHIFDPFFTTKKKNNQSGTGLGLSTVYGIIHSAGGFIKVDSVPNVGTTFTVYLPRFEEKDKTIIAPPTEIQNVFLPQAKAPILLVDDEDAIRTVTSRALTSKGFTVEEAPSAEKALDILNKRSDFQLVITDMVMSGMDGEELITKIKKINPKIPCLLMSGYSDSFEKHTSDKPKDFDFISKPFVLSDLLEKVKEILEKDQKV